MMFDAQRSGIFDKFIVTKQLTQNRYTMRTIRGIALVLGISASVQAQTLMDAIKMTGNEQYESATGVYKKLLAADPANGDIYYYYGENLFQSEKMDSAKKMFEKGMELNPTNMINYVGLGKVLWNQNKQQEANTNFHKARELTKSKDARILLKIADVYIHSDVKELEKATELLNICAKLEPNNPEVYLLTGDIFLERNDGSKAVENFNKAADLNKSSVTAVLRLGQLYGRARNYNLAFEYYEKANAIDANFAPAYREKAELLYRAGKYDLAVENYKKYLQLNNDFGARVRYASFLYLSKNYTEAINEINNILTKDKNNAIMYRLRAYSYYENKEYEKGMKDIESFFSLAIDNNTKIIASDYEYHGKLISKMGNDSLGVLKMEQALEIDPSRTDMYGEIGAIYYKSKKYPKAIWYFEKEIASTPNAGATQYRNLGMAYYGNGEYEKADNSFKKITELRPELVIGYYQRARANVKLDPEMKSALAKPYYEKVIEVGLAEAAKNKKELAEAYEYLGFYYFDKDKVLSKENYKKVLEIDANNEKAKKALESL